MTVQRDRVERAARAWGLDARGSHLLRGGPTTVVRLPAAAAVLRFHRREASERRVGDLHSARAVLRQAGVPTVPLLRTPDGSSCALVDGRVVEAEPWVEHDGRMNTPPHLVAGAALLAAVHNAWEDVRLGVDGERCSWANWISPDDVRAKVRSGVERVAHVRDLRGFRDAAVRLADQVAAEPAGLVEQIVHGDFWDDNVYVRDGRLVAVTDFDFVARRPRVDDLALLLYFADEQPEFEGVTDRDARTRIAASAPLVRAYCTGLRTPLSDQERQALPFAIARQPLWAISTWLPLMQDDAHAETEARSLVGAVDRALQVVDHADRWREQVLAAR